MYCSMCGGEIGDKLNFCNKCGAKLVKDDGGKGPRSILGMLVTSVSFISIFGFGILIALVAVLLKENLPFEFVVMTAMFYLISLTSICFMLLRPVLRLASGQSDRSGETKEIPGSYAAPQLERPRPAALNEPLQGVASVTEHTTRTLDEVMAERK